MPKIWRVYSGADGQSHVEEVPLVRLAGPPRAGWSQVMVSNPSTMNTCTFVGASGNATPTTDMPSLNSFEGGLDPNALTARTRT